MKSCASAGWCVQIDATTPLSDLWIFFIQKLASHEKWVLLVASIEYCLLTRTLFNNLEVKSPKSTQWILSQEFRAYLMVNLWEEIVISKHCQPRQLHAPRLFVRDFWISEAGEPPRHFCQGFQQTRKLNKGSASPAAKRMDMMSWNLPGLTIYRDIKIFLVMWAHSPPTFLALKWWKALSTLAAWNDCKQNAVMHKFCPVSSTVGL